MEEPAQLHRLADPVEVIQQKTNESSVAGSVVWGRATLVSHKRGCSGIFFFTYMTHNDSHFHAGIIKAPDRIRFETAQPPPISSRHFWVHFGTYRGSTQTRLKLSSHVRAPSPPFSEPSLETLNLGGSREDSNYGLKFRVQGGLQMD